MYVSMTERELCQWELWLLLGTYSTWVEARVIWINGEVTLTGTSCVEVRGIRPHGALINRPQ